MAIFLSCLEKYYGQHSVTAEIRDQGLFFLYKLKNNPQGPISAEVMGSGLWVLGFHQWRPHLLLVDIGLLAWRRLQVAAPIALLVYPRLSNPELLMSVRRGWEEVQFKGCSMIHELCRFYVGLSLF